MAFPSKKYIWLKLLLISFWKVKMKLIFWGRFFTFIPFFYLFFTFLKILIENAGQSLTKLEVAICNA